MENTSEKKDKNSVKKPLKHICIGLVAHVDAGKTTLSEGMLYLSGQIRNMGRVDHGDTFLIVMKQNENAGSRFFQNRRNLYGMIRVLRFLTLPGMWIFQQRWNECCRCLTAPYLLSAL